MKAKKGGQIPDGKVPASVSPFEEFQVTVEAEVYPAETYLFRVHQGTAKLSGREWNLSTNVAGGCPIIQIPDGRWVIFQWPTLIDAANKAAEQARLALRIWEGKP